MLNPRADDWLLQSLKLRPQTFQQLHTGLHHWGYVEDAYRYVDKWLQRARKKGLITFERQGRDCVWRAL